MPDTCATCRWLGETLSEPAGKHRCNRFPRRNETFASWPACGEFQPRPVEQVQELSETAIG